MEQLKKKRERLIEETLDSLRNKPIKSTMFERIVCMDEADQLLEDEPQPLKLGKGLGYILANCSLPVSPDDILLGRIEEVVPNEVQEHYLTDFQMRFHGAMRPDWLVDGGHITLSWETLLKIGLGGYIQEAKESLARHIQEDAPQEKCDFIQGMILVYQAYQNYIGRYAKAARKQGLEKLAQMSEHIAQEPPRTFYEAMQLMLFVGHVYSVYASINSTLTYGRMDDILLPYYMRDLEEGLMTREEAGWIIEDFYCKNNLILGRGEHQLSGDEATDTGWFRNPTYDTPQYIVLGGYSNQHDHVNNPLTALFVRCIHPRFENPFIVFRYTKDINKEVWHTLCERIRENASIMIYNDENQIPSMIKAGFDYADCIDYTMHGCNWPDIPGKYAQILYSSCLMVNRIMTILMDGSQKLKQEYDSIDVLYETLFEGYREEMSEVAKNYRKIKAAFPKRLSTRLSCIDCFTDGTIASGKDIYSGAAKYAVLYNVVRNIGTATDMMAALDQVVYTDHKATLSEMVEALKHNFEGYEDLRRACLNAPKYGTDHTFADAHARRLMKGFTDIVEEASINEVGVKDMLAFNITTTDMWHIAEGRQMMATPDGRLAGEPFSENLSPTAGARNNGLTALLRSVAQLPLENVHAGAFNLRLQPDWIKGDEGLRLLEIVLQTYFEEGGMQVQVTVADTHTLLDAQLHPENYRDLMVRITGYSAAFVDMSKKAQDE
ncbi:MAG: pyruvate formate lyase family protein, partial [Cellulosilyticaceae bacterium]